MLMIRSSIAALVLVAGSSFAIAQTAARQRPPTLLPLRQQLRR